MTSNPPKICIVTQSHLCRNPRVLKEAIALATAGYNIKIFSTFISAGLLAQDHLAISAYPNIGLYPIADFSKPSLSSFTNRLFNKLGRLAVQYLNMQTGLSLGYAVAGYYHKVIAAKADLYICHQELATYIGFKLIKKGFKVAFDLEDWYSEDLLPEARIQRPLSLLRQLEATALNKGLFCLTTSKVLAARLAVVYSCPVPKVIYNVFPSPSGAIVQAPKQFSQPLKLFWFSQTIGPGRGLEQFISLIATFKTGLQLHLLGNVNTAYHEKLLSLMAAPHQLFFHELVHEHELPAKIALFDIGLALELDTPMSRNYTITNKFFQYIQSGLPVIASQTAGQKEAFEKFGPGFMLSQQPGSQEARELEQWLSNPTALHAAREKAIEASGYYNWENESKKLITIVTDSLETKS